jgi:hypothetical protein
VKSVKRNWKLVAAIVFIPIAAYSAFFLVLRLGYDWATDPSRDCNGDVDVAKWQRTSPSKNVAARRDLAFQIEACGTLDGATKAEVSQALGAMTPPAQPSSRQWSYTVGSCDSRCLFDSDTVYLDVDFGDDGTVASVDVFGT